VLTAPIITRLYEPADFGLVAVLSSFVGILSILATFRYEMALTLSRNEEDALGILSLCLLLVSASTLAVALLAWACGQRLFAWLGVPNLYAYWWMVPASLLGAGVYQSLGMYSLRRKAYKDIAVTRLDQAVGGAATSIGLGLLRPGPLGLLLSNLASGSLGIARLGQGVLGQAVRTKGLFKRSIRALKAHRRFATFTAGAACFNSTGTLLPPLLFAVFYGQETVGSIGLAQKVVGLPMSVLGSAVGQVFLAEASEMVRERPAQINGFFRSVTYRMAPPALGVLAVGMVCPFVFPEAFGARWQTAGFFAAMMAVYCAFQLVVSPISNIAIITQRQDLQLSLDVARTVVVSLAICVPAYWGKNELTVMGCYAIAQTLLYGLYFTVYYHLARTYGNSSASRSAIVRGHAP
jgi:O-antigen/teichoic acid export membrane protein